MKHSAGFTQPEKLLDAHTYTAQADPHLSTHWAALFITVYTESVNNSKHSSGAPNRIQTGDASDGAECVQCSGHRLTHITNSTEEVI